MNAKTLHKITYGLYIISAKQQDKYNGQIANTVFQITSDPVTIAVSINKQNLTHEYIKKSKLLTVSILTQAASMSLIGKFGFKSGREINKFEDTPFKLSPRGVPIIEESALGYLEGEVISEVDLGTHTVFIVRVTDADLTGEEEPMTYAYYHQVKKGKAPQTAPTYIKEEVKQLAGKEKYICTVCGYVYDPEQGDPEAGIEPGVPFEELPEDWVCPVCGVGKDSFEKQQ